MGRLRRLVVVVLAAIAIGLAVVLLTVGLDNAVKIASVGGFLVATGGLAFTAAQWFRQRETAAPDSPGRVVDDLARAVRQQWRAEESMRRLQDPAPIALRWRMVERDSPLQDHWENIDPDWTFPRGSQSGRFDDLVPVFHRIPSRRLVVIGGSGAGKTALATRLTLGLIESRADGDPVPVLLPMSTWNPDNASLHQWLTQRLATEHPGLSAYVGRDQTRASSLLRNGLIIPVLDGLDEIAEPLRGNAIRRINAELHPGDPLVITCRAEEFTDLVSQADVVTAAAVLRLRPLEIDDLLAYLPMTTRKNKWKGVLDSARRPGSGGAVLLEALDTPLMTSLARAAYSDTGEDPGELLKAKEYPNIESISNHLLDTFVPSVYGFPGDLSDEQKQELARLKKWIQYLARWLKDEGTRELAWWRLNPGARSMPTTLEGLLLGVVAGLTFWLVAGPLFGAVVGVVTTLATSLVTLPQPNEPSRVRFRLRGSATVLRHRLFGRGIRVEMLWKSAGVLGWLVGGVVLMIALGVVGGPLGVVVGIVAIVLANLLDGWLDVPVDVSRVADPVSMLRADRTAAVVCGVLRGLIIGGALAFLSGPLTSAALGVTAMVVSIAHTAWAKFVVIRVWLAITGRLPWRLMTFLVEAHRRGVLRQVGGQYQFRHSRLQDHFCA
jgi:hypothetical protein